MDISVILTIIGGITALTNIISQVVKKVTWDKLPTNILVLIIGIILTLTAGGAYAQIKCITVTWYMVCGAVVVGFLVAYAAMFGYDKLMEVLGHGKG